MNPIFLNTELHPKAWGGESWICNNEEFCGKLLTIKAGAKFSMHFHRDKREVFWVLSGMLTLATIDTATAIKSEVVLTTGDIVEIPRLLPHQLTGLEDSKVVEFSTHHEDSDSYRVTPGDSQTLPPPPLFRLGG